MLCATYKCYAVAALASACSAGAKAAAFSVLVTFGCCSSPHQAPPYPVGEPLVDALGNLYGATRYGGSSDYGSIYKVTPQGQFSVIYSFPSDPQQPAAGVAIDAKGRLVGTTGEDASANLWGSAYVLGPILQQSTEFQYGNGGPATPGSAFVPDGRGNMITTSAYGGAYDNGTIFRLSPDGKITVFSMPSGYHGPTTGLLTVDSHGNVFGAAEYPNDGFGAIFKLSPEGEFTTVHNFAAFNECYWPTAGYVINKAGDLFGTTFNDYLEGGGCLFKISRDGEYSVVYHFVDNPNGDLVADASGNIYGTTGGGGTYGDGTVFKLSPGGQETVLHSFSGPDGRNPSDGVILAPNGNLYGVTYNGGTNDKGVLYEVKLTK